MRKVLLYSLLLLLFSCDVFEEDLSNDIVVVLAPSNGVSTTKASQTFWWEDIDEALKYKIQIVTPDFNSVSQLILDSNVTANKVKYTLQPGTYQWRVKAENASSETPYTTYNLTVDTTSDLADQEVVLVSPLNNAVEHDTILNLQWQELSAATQYRMQIVSKGFGHPAAVTLFDGVVSGSPHTQVFSGKLEDYYWRVRGENLSTVTNFSNAWLITIDTAQAP